MRANEKLKGSNGFEVALFPCETLYLTEARDPDEHSVYALDFLPKDTAGNTITAMKCYAPFSGRIVYAGNDHNCILESDTPVNTPLGVKYMRVLVAHSEVAPVLYTHYNQGSLFYTTGNYADQGHTSGEHLHMEVALVDDPSEQKWNTGGVGLYKGIHMWEGLYVNNTVLLRPESYNWQQFGGIPTFGTKRNKFPWVLYANRIRNRYNTTK